jgi:putative membrane protein
MLFLPIRIEAVLCSGSPGKPAAAAGTISMTRFDVVSYFPAIEACLNSLSAVLLTTGFVFIRKKRIQAHKKCMLSAFAASCLFLIFYLAEHFLRGVVYFRGRGAIRTFYLALLGTHTILAAVIVPLALITLYRAWRRRFDLHKRIARWTLPIWLYVSVTGVVIYWMLFHLYRPA